MSHFKLPLTCYAGGTCNWLSCEPQTTSFFGFGNWNKHLGHSLEKWKSSHSSAVRCLHCFANFKRARRCFSVKSTVTSIVVETAPSLSYSCVAILSILNPINLYSVFAVTSFELSFLACTGLFPVLVWSSNSSRADHFTTQRALLFNNFDISLTDNSEDLKMEAGARKYYSFSVLSGHISEKNK